MSTALWCRVRSLGLLACLVVVGVSLHACRSGDDVSKMSSETYRKAVAAFYTGLAAIQASAERIAEEHLQRATELAPQEPAAWANLGLLALRRTAFDVAAERLQHAQALAPESSHIHVLLGRLENMRGRPEEAEAFLRQAMALDPHNLKAIYALVELLEEQGSESGVVEVQRLLTGLLDSQPHNLAVLLELARVATKRADLETLREVIGRLQDTMDSWPPVAREQFQALQDAVAAAHPARMVQHVLILKNVLARHPAYGQGLAAVHTPFGQMGEPLPHFLRLPAPRPTPAAPDTALTFAAAPIAMVGGPWTWIGTVSLDNESPPAVIVAHGRRVRLRPETELAFPGGPEAQQPQQYGIVGLDIDNDFTSDLALAGAAGLALWRQDDSGTLTEVTAQLELPDAVTRAPYVGVWAADIDAEGDMDLVLGTPEDAPLVLRNNGDGTFTVLRPFDGMTALRAFAWGDLDADGDADAVMLDRTGTVQVYVNQRAGRFRAHSLPPELGQVLAIAVADLNSDSRLDLIALQADGTVQRLWSPAEEQAWRLVEVVRWTGMPEGNAVAEARLLVADLDNNGGLDLIASTPTAWQVWLSDSQGHFRLLEQTLPGPVSAVADLNGDGRLDLLGLSSTGQPRRLVNQGTTDYFWLTLQPRAVPVKGDGRINSFGLGGEVDVRAGLLFQKQPITGPRLHFGLGEHRRADVARILWPNGDVQAVFDLQSNQVVVARQLLKGSCPWVFAYDGDTRRFVTDFLWRSPLGLRINAQDTANVLTTEDWVKIRADQLVPRDGMYDLHITAELWETHFIDHIALLIVDHPVETAIHVDERFAVPPPPLAVYSTAPPRPVAQAWDDRGQEVTEVVRTRDGRYLDTFGRGDYQGITREHYVELDLGPGVPASGPLWLLASGWIRPTDSSINVAISQGRHPQPQSLRLEVPDGQGGWTTARADLGFPAGKTKTIVLDLQGLWRPGTPRRLRLRTNLEIYWDAFAWAPGVPDGELRTQRLSPQTATLRYRGFSVVQVADRSSPELPQYDLLDGTAPRWRDLIGYYTRFGDVRELLQTVDDRYVIMNAGNELVLRFTAPAPPPTGWQRDFVLIGDGWVKDGDYHTTFSKTVRPLPAHAQTDYTTPPGALEDDPVYRRHAQDWQRYHTRYVTPRRFHEALRTP